VDTRLPNRPNGDRLDRDPVPTRADPGVDVFVAPRLPASLEARPARPDDLAEVVALIVRCDVADLGAPDTELDDIGAAWRRPGHDLARNTILVEADGRVVAYGDVFEGEAFGVVDPTWRGQGIGSWLLHRMEHLARQDAAPGVSGPGGSGPGEPERGPDGPGPGGSGRVLEISAPAGDRAFRSLAERGGYRPGRSTWLMRLDMTGPPPPPVWPVGIGVRTFDRDRDARAVHRLVQDAFADIGGQHPRSFEFWAETSLERADFDPELWFLAEAGDGLVGANLCFAGPLGGYVAQLAVRRDHRGRGLGMALLRHGFGALHRRGIREVYLDVDSENHTGATRLYERAGMRVQHRYDNWVKQLE
jgi:mycothiol synthase